MASHVRVEGVVGHDAGAEERVRAGRLGVRNGEARGQEVVEGRFRGHATLPGDGRPVGALEQAEVPGYALLQGLAEAEPEDVRRPGIRVRRSASLHLAPGRLRLVG